MNKQQIVVTVDMMNRYNNNVKYCVTYCEYVLFLYIMKFENHQVMYYYLACSVLLIYIKYILYVVFIDMDMRCGRKILR